uniref:Cadherin 17, LI cadherin (liver-intestine) n=1 Tax=Nothobranchius furzeri TaxID=105023 RepID=A0A8C6LXQ6_NOTFU
MTPMVHLLLLPFLCSIVGGTNLEEKKGPFVNTELDVPEGTPVPYAVYQFQVTHAGVNGFRLSGEGKDIKVSKDGWLYLEKPLDWSQDDQYILSVEALADNVVVDGPVIVTINVLDVNNNAPQFNQSRYTATVREKTSSGEHAVMGGGRSMSVTQVRQLPGLCYGNITPAFGFILRRRLYPSVRFRSGRPRDRQRSSELQPRQPDPQQPQHPDVSDPSRHRRDLHHKRGRTDAEGPSRNPVQPGRRSEHRRAEDQV